MPDNLKFEIKGSIGYIILNTPPTNTLQMHSFVELDSILNKCVSNKNLKGLLIFGNGRHFSQGSNTEELAQMTLSDNKSVFYKNVETLQKLRKLSIPAIALLSGVCLGSAFELALYCDYRFATEKTIIGLPETGFNLIPGLGGISLLNEHMSESQILEMVLPEKNYTGKEAYEIGIVDYITKKNMLIFDAEKFICSIDAKYDKSIKKIYIDRFLYRIYIH